MRQNIWMILSCFPWVRKQEMFTLISGEMSQSLYENQHNSNTIMWQVGKMYTDRETLWIGEEMVVVYCEVQSQFVLRYWAKQHATN